jgi:hypothetical protein
VSNDGEPIRLLAVRSEHAYTDVPALAMRDEPEAVSEANQRELTRDARARWRVQQAQVWKQARALIVEALDVMTAASGADLALTSGARVIAREVSRVDRRIREL